MTGLGLTPEQLRDFIAENVTIVRPGETLVIRVTDLTPEQMAGYQDRLNVAHEYGFIPFRCLVVYGEELGVAEASL